MGGLEAHGWLAKKSNKLNRNYDFSPLRKACVLGGDREYVVKLGLFKGQIWEDVI